MDGYLCFMVPHCFTAGGSCTAFQCDHADDKRGSEQVGIGLARVGIGLMVGVFPGGSLNILVNNAFKFGAADPELERALSQGAKFYDIPLSTCAAARSVSYLFTPAYGIGKAAVDRMARDFQVELGPQGVDCLSVWPGVVLTEKRLKSDSTERATFSWTVAQTFVEVPGARLTLFADVFMAQELSTGNMATRTIASYISAHPAGKCRVIGRLAADDQLRRPPYVTPDGLTGRICIVAEAPSEFVTGGGSQDEDEDTRTRTRGQGRARRGRRRRR
ncbi:unnamed protein product [Prorocentrum cordatum]|uniref:Uncharacterized protein n=1 Tax=Prorocentrum cordatum TaxID=2364126 RepID=A0ABN9SQK6_9DINO|nr:unnamed protein product [Polarella glacialis]